MTDSVWIGGLSTLEEAQGVRDLFLEVYGSGYPVDVYYRPEELLRINREGDTRSVIARTQESKVVAHMAYFPSAPNSELRELGAGLVSPQFRGQGVLGDMVEGAVKIARESGNISTIFAESVCNHTFSQRLVHRLGFVDTALELNLMPAEAYKAEKSATGRVASALAFLSLRKSSSELVLPETFAERLEQTISWFGAPRGLTVDRLTDEPRAKRSELKAHHIEMASLTRLEIKSLGQDLTTAVEALSRNDAVTQVYLPLRGEHVQWAVQALLQTGFIFGGFLPHWAGADCVLFQRFIDPVVWSELEVYSENCRRIADWARGDLSSGTSE